MDPHPYPDLSVRWPRLGAEPLLGIDRRRHRVTGRCERREQRVTLGLELDTVVGRVIEAYARRFGYGVIRDFTGHGIGTAFHSGLIVPHYDAAPNHGTRWIVQVTMNCAARVAARR